MYIATIFTHLGLEAYTNKNLRYSFKATAGTANKDKL